MYVNVHRKYRFSDLIIVIYTANQADSVAGSVIQASGMVLFEDGLEAGALGVDIMSAPRVHITPVVNLASHVRSHSDLGV